MRRELINIAVSRKNAAKILSWNDNSDDSRRINKTFLIEKKKYKAWQYKHAIPWKDRTEKIEGFVD